MQWRALLCGLALVPLGMTAPAEDFVAARHLPSKSVIGLQDIAASTDENPGEWASASDLIGLETRKVIYEGQTLRRADLVSPAMVERNQLVTIFFQKGGLRIMAQGRSLSRGARGDAVRVMNLASRQTLPGIVEPDGTIRIGAAR